MGQIGPVNIYCSTLESPKKKPDNLKKTPKSLF